MVLSFWIPGSNTTTTNNKATKATTENTSELQIDSSQNPTTVTVSSPPSVGSENSGNSISHSFATPDNSPFLKEKQHVMTTTTTDKAATTTPENNDSAAVTNISMIQPIPDTTMNIRSRAMAMNVTPQDRPVSFTSTQSSVNSVNHRTPSKSSTTAAGNTIIATTTPISAAKTVSTTSSTPPDSSFSTSSSSTMTRIPTLQPRKLSEPLDTPSGSLSVAKVAAKDNSSADQQHTHHKSIHRTISESNVTPTSAASTVVANTTTIKSQSNSTTSQQQKSNRNTSPVPQSYSGAKVQFMNSAATRTPTRQRNMDIAPFGSPGIFLSPYLPSPPDSKRTNDINIQGNNTNVNNSNTNDTNTGRPASVVNTNNNKQGTPTNFARDFGRTDLSSSSFDANNGTFTSLCFYIHYYFNIQQLIKSSSSIQLSYVNRVVLPWLSPTALSLFSPGGGIASATNTPGGIFASFTPKSPRSPNGGKLTLPLSNTSTTKRNHSNNANISSMICVSPLASRKSASSTSVSITSAHNNTKMGIDTGNQKEPETPINFREVFASPKTDSNVGIRTEISNEIPELGSSLSLEKHIAERDIREDEDLNVLLRLAETTPNRKAVEPKPSSRSFRNQFAYTNHSGAPSTYLHSSAAREPPMSLHLPFIGKNGTNTDKSRNKANVSSANEFNRPTLPIRSNATSPIKATSNRGEQNNMETNQQRKSLPKSTLYPSQYPNTSTHIHHHIYSHPPTYYPYPPSHGGSGHPPPHTYSLFPNAASSASGASLDNKKGMKVTSVSPKSSPEIKKRTKRSTSRKGGKRQRTTVTMPLTGQDREKSAATITALNASTGSKNDKAAALAAAILRGVTMRPSGKWQAQLYYAGKSRYIGVFDTREKAALAYEIAREKLKTDRPASEQNAQSLKETEANVNAARKAAFEGVNEKDPRIEK